MIDVGQAAGGFQWGRISNRVWLVVIWRFCVLSVCQRGVELGCRGGTTYAKLHMRGG